MGRWPAAVLAGVMLLTSPLAPSAQSPAQAADAQIQATFTVRLAAGKSTYAIGELIPLELEFVGKADQDYYFSNETYDRSGRLGSEEYGLTPAEGFVDPLADHYRGGLSGVIGGGARSWHALDGKPFILRVHLNEWVQFTRPGRYRLSATSTRLGRYSRQPVTTSLKSATVDLVIVPATDDWAADQLKAALSAIDNGSRDQTKDGVTRLRHLGTAAAALALVERYVPLNQEFSFDVFAGLIGSPHRAAIVTAMEARIDGGGPIAARFVQDLGLLKVFLEQPRDTGDPSARLERYKVLVADFNRRWTTAFVKRGVTPESMDVALKQLAIGGDPALESSLADFAASGPGEAAAAFLALPATTQRILLEFRWERVNRPWIRPVLDALYTRPAAARRDPAGVKDLALRRISAIDPAAGRRLILDEIASGEHGIGFDALATLPDTPPADLDDRLRERWTRPSDYETTAWLMWRYGSPALLPLVEASLERRWACAIEAGLIAYLLKHRPESAMARLSPSFDRRAGCVVAPFDSIGRRAWDGNVEKAAIATLASPETRVATDAARVLAQFGSAAVKAPLLARLERWEAEWRGRAAALVYDPRVMDAPGQLEGWLINALFENPRVNLTGGELARIRTLCVTDACRTTVDARIRNRR